MADENQERAAQQRGVKVTGENAVHRVGTKRAAIKPHKRVTAPDPKQLINDYLGTLGAGSLSQTYLGDTLTKNAALLRKTFALAADDELYLLVDPSASGRAGMLLSKSGLHVADGRGGTGEVGWKDLPSCNITYQRGMLVIGQTGIQTNDAKAMAALLQKIQAAYQA